MEELSVGPDQDEIDELIEGKTEKPELYGMFVCFLPLICFSINHKLKTQSLQTILHLGKLNIW